MAKKFVRGITDIKTINNQDFDTNNVNDLLSDGEHNYIHRKKGKTEEYHNLTDNIKSISSSNTDLIEVDNNNTTNNTATLKPKHDIHKEQVLESTRNTITIEHGENGTPEATKVDTNPEKVLEHENLLTGYGITKTYSQDTSTLSLSDTFLNDLASLGQVSKTIELHVGRGQTYATIDDALINVTGSSAMKQYDIIVHEGQHHFKMTGDNQLPDYVNIKGATGNYEDVEIIGELPADSDDTTIKQTSTFYISKNNTFKDLTITAKNMRYAVHDESSGVFKDWARCVENCKIVHHGNTEVYQHRESISESTEGVWVHTYAWGQGCSSGAKSYFDNVIFESPTNPFYCHEPNHEDSPKPYFMKFTNCIFKTSKDNYTRRDGVTIDNNRQRSNSKNVIIFNNCSFDRTRLLINGNIPIDVRVHGSNQLTIKTPNIVNFPKTDRTMMFYYNGDEPLSGFEKLAIDTRNGYEYVVKATDGTPANEVVGVNVSGVVNKGDTVVSSSDKMIINGGTLIIN